MSASSATPDFNLADGHGYMLGRSYAAAPRLNLQYFLWKESLQFDIHPSIPITKGPMQIADVATGTAIWLTEVARQMPTASLYGFDVNLAQAPPREWLPSNVTLVPWNIFDKVPEDMCGRFDVVHVRLLILVVQNSNPSNIIRSLVKMLKPGGYIQWDDLNYPDTHVRVAGRLSKTSKSDELRTMVYSQGRHDWTLELDRFFGEAGLLDSKIFHYQDRPDLARANGEQHLLTMEEFALALAATEREGEASKILQLIKDVHEEVLTGAALSMPRVVCVGRISESTIEGN